MPPVVIDNPILNSAFREPARHFRFDDEGITNEKAEFRRRSTYFMPIPQPRTKGGGQLALVGDFATESQLALRGAPCGVAGYRALRRATGVTLLIATLSYAP